MNIETIPHLFDVTNNQPTGQRGLLRLLAQRRQGGDANAFRLLRLG